MKTENIILANAVNTLIVAIRHVQDEYEFEKNEDGTEYAILSDALKRAEMLLEIRP